MDIDYLVVGAGLTGSVIARHLFDEGHSVLIVDRRQNPGGNVQDSLHESGVRVHSYGPHYFRTNDHKIWNFVNRFSVFYGYEAKVMTWVNGRFEGWPISKSYITREAGHNWKPDFSGKPTNFEEASLSMMPRIIYQRFVKGYTEKQWGVPAATLALSLARRFDVRDDNDGRLMRHRYQGLPKEGYSHLMARMISKIPIHLNVDYLKYRGMFRPRRLTIFTGAIDEYFGFDLGKLKYRGQQREHAFMSEVRFAQPCGQVNNPDVNAGPHIRTLEWKYMMPSEDISKISGTLITKEIPVTPNNPDQYEYPFPDKINRALYKAYAMRARADSSLLICGRLGEYRYYDMDQAIARAMLLAKRILAQRTSS